MTRKPKKDKPQKTGPKAEIIKISGDWEQAVDTALKKKRPAEGWPKSKK